MPLLLRLARTAATLILMAVVVSALNDQSIKVSGISIVWLSNGLLTGVLLCYPRKQWPVFLILGFVIDVGVNHLLGGDWVASPVFAASICSRSLSRPPRLPRHRSKS